MTDTELKKLTLAKAIEMIARREISADELTAAVVARIHRLNPDMRAFITVMEGKSTGGPRSASALARSPKNRPPLQGVPVSVKDLYDTQGVRTTAGSKIFAERVPEEDATAVEKLKDAGAGIIGKTNLHEFAFGVTNVNPHFGTARNPWDRDRICGGSSGGSACAVALGMGFGSLGSDTGGSIRIPASLCGVVGLKPTYGLVSLQGVVPLSWSFDHAGPIARTVEDTALLLEIISGRYRYTDALTGNIKSIRVGIPTNYFYEGLAQPVESALHDAIGELEKLGAKILKVEIPGIDIHRGTWLQIASPEAYSYHELRLREHADMYGADVRGRLEAGRRLLSIDYVRAQRARTLIKEETRRLFNNVDVIVTPTVPIPAPRIDELHKPWGSGPETAALSLARFTRFFNVTGIPTISIPCGFTSAGLPIGMQIAGKAFDEVTVLRVAHAYEQHTKWFERIPEL